MKTSGIVLLLLLIVFGATNTLILSLMNKIKFNTAPETYFIHPLIQALLMSIGEILCIVPYIFLRGREKSGFNAVFNPLVVMFPAFMDLISTILAYSALNMIDSSVWQISRGGNIISVAILSKLLLKTQMSKSGIIGCFIAFLGITGVQIVSILYGSNSSDTKTTLKIIGCVLLLCSLIFNGLALISQKRIFNKYDIHPLKMVFLQGFYNTIAMGIVCQIATWLPCPWPNQKCILIHNQYRMESYITFFNQIKNNIFLLYYVIGLIISISISVPIAVTISKKINPLSRALGDICRTLIIWIVGIVITETKGKNNSDYKMQDLDLVPNLLKGICFGLLIYGTLLYHNLVPFCQKQSSIQQSSLLSEGSNSEIQDSMDNFKTQKNYEKLG